MRFRASAEWRKDHAVYDATIRSLVNCRMTMIHVRVDEVINVRTCLVVCGKRGSDLFCSQRLKQDKIRITRPTFQAILEAYASKTSRRHASIEASLSLFATSASVYGLQGVRALVDWMKKIGITRTSDMWVSIIDAHTNSKFGCKAEDAKAIEDVCFIIVLILLTTT